MVSFLWVVAVLASPAMASISSLHLWTSDHCHCRLPRISSALESDQARPTNQSLAFSIPISRRDAILLGSMPLTSFVVLPQNPSEARERRSKKVIPIEEYQTSPDGLKYYDLEEGKGLVAERGSTVQVHFDCLYRGITAVSSRESKLLAGNRSIAQPYEFKVGSTPGKERKREFVDNPNGLFSAQAAPKPPPAMYFITEGMKVGGKRTVIVPPEAGYGKKGMNEIPPEATFVLNIELLQLIPPEEK
ncbi:PREDICTED: peptidyl-prolyl cis-trans isomerase FKBP18, chloroplastic [Tarenaya hassleriana]|uniref:peptidyl-prolyl cis-trans isomerase FKBP18, chloroplastic n=1 Tax=Tarenaya hassleriana TaxID=28532 RepID=UPI00053C080F|nr:PREDICTED: peptidyl-prolyl cis-trans isomerase FKBP18, chloroplastic [Tarenaya hassleriana]